MHQVGQPGESARVAGVAPAMPAAGAAQNAPSTERAERGHQRQGHQQGHRDNAHPGGPHGPDEGDVENEQAGQRDGHDDSRIADGASRRGHGCRHGLLGARAGHGCAAGVGGHPILLADRRVEVHQIGEAEQRGERPGDGGNRSHDRDSGRHEAAKDHDHHQETQRQGDAFTTLAVDLDLVDDPVHEQAQTGPLRPGGVRGFAQVVEDVVDGRVCGGDLLAWQVPFERHDRREATGPRVAVGEELSGRLGIGACRNDIRIHGLSHPGNLHERLHGAPRRGGDLWRRGVNPLEHQRV